MDIGIHVAPALSRRHTEMVLFVANFSDAKRRPVIKDRGKSGFRFVCSEQEQQILRRWLQGIAEKGQLTSSIHNEIAEEAPDIVIPEQTWKYDPNRHRWGPMRKERIALTSVLNFCAYEILVWWHHGHDKRVRSCIHCGKFFMDWPSSRGRSKQTVCEKACSNRARQAAYKLRHK